jgi:hypothetical protein
MPLLEPMDQQPTTTVLIPLLFPPTLRENPQQFQSDVEATYRTLLSILTWTPTTQRQQLYCPHFALSNSSWQSTCEVLPLALYHDDTLFLTTKALQRMTLSQHSAKKLQYLTIWSPAFPYMWSNLYFTASWKLVHILETPFLHLYIPQYVLPHVLLPSVVSW